MNEAEEATQVCGEHNSMQYALRETERTVVPLFKVAEEISIFFSFGVKVMESVQATASGVIRSFEIDRAHHSRKWNALPREENSLILNTFGDHNKRKRADRVRKILLMYFVHFKNKVSHWFLIHISYYF